RAEVDASEREIALVRAQEAQRMARADLESAVGEPLTVSDTLEVPLPPGDVLPDSARVVAEALAARPEIASLDRQIEQARQQVAAARAGHRPQLALAGTAEYRAPNKNKEYANFSD